MLKILRLIALLIRLVASRPSNNLGYMYSPIYNNGANSVTTSYGESVLNSNFLGSSNTAIQAQSGQCVPLEQTPSNQYFSASSRSQAQQQFESPIVTKNFYVYTAPKSLDNQEMVRHINIGRPQKNYRVIFINTESSLSSKAKIIANVAPVEEKTAIYVLSKQSSDLAINTDIVTPAPIEQSKPNVFFIKYNTSEEAIRAQSEIQAQYDSLGGISRTSNEHIIPTTSIIDGLQNQNVRNIVTPLVIGVASNRNHETNESAYLPPAK